MLSDVSAPNMMRMFIVKSLISRRGGRLFRFIMALSPEAWRFL